MEIDTKKLEEAVLAEAVESLVHNYTSGEESLRDEIRAEATKIIKDAIQYQIKATLVAGINSLTFPQGNKYQEPKGPVLTLREEIDRQIQFFLQQEVDSEGKVREYSSSKEPRIRWLLRQELGNHIDASVKAAAQEIKKAISATIGAIVKGELDKAVAKLR